MSKWLKMSFAHQASLIPQLKFPVSGTNSNKKTLTEFDQISNSVVSMEVKHNMLLGFQLGLGTLGIRHNLI